MAGYMVRAARMRQAVWCMHVLFSPHVCMCFSHHMHACTYHITCCLPAWRMPFACGCSGWLQRQPWLPHAHVFVLHLVYCAAIRLMTRACPPPRPPPHAQVCTRRAGACWPARRSSASATRQHAYATGKLRSCWGTRWHEGLDSCGLVLYCS